MNPTYRISFSKLLLELLFLVTPTILVMYLVINRATGFLTILDNSYLQTIYFGAGAVIAYLLYALRVRFIITFPLLVLLLYTAYKSIEKYYPGEFDSFFVSIRFLLFSIVFTSGWLTGFGLARFRNFPMLLAMLMMVLHIIMLQQEPEPLFLGILGDFLPIVFYALYIIYIRRLLDSIEAITVRSFIRLMIRYGLFILLILSLFRLTTWMLEKSPKLNMLQEKMAGGASGDGKSMEDDLLKKERNQTFDMKNYQELRSQLGRTDELLFCAYVNNFFPGSDQPNPLYFVRYYLTRYDQKNERFEADPNMPSNDLFDIDPSKVPLYFTKSDSNVIKNGKGDKYRKVVDVDVYLNKLSPSTFVSPSISFSVQPITVEDEYKEIFKSAYRTKNYVSELNSAYFVYNAEQPEIRALQEKRHDILSGIKDYKEVDPEFLQYYLDVPKGPTYDSIRKLAQEVTKGAATPIDKVVKVRDYFLSKTESGEPLFVYTLTPGSPNDPNIPNASKLSYFLFQNRKGYCTYFAGATLFMLRSVGVPTRMAAGFMTVDRSDKNKGWYYFYGDQAHAWVQIYFPGYGWLDFDTTIGAEESRESPQPDGTPPIQPPKAWLAATGTIVEKGDTASRSATLSIGQMVYHDQELKPEEEAEVILDLKHATIKDNTGIRSFKDLKEGDHVLIVSYDEKLKKLGPHKKGHPVNKLIARFPTPVPVDEVHIKPKEEKKQEERINEQTDKAKEEFNSKVLLWLLLFLILPLLPWLTFMIMRMRANAAGDARAKAYRIYRLSEFLHHQLGYPREGRTPLEFAENVIDKEFQSGYSAFMRVYLKTKYANVPLGEQDVKTIDSYYPAFIRRVLSKLSTGKKLSRFIDFTSTFAFWTRGLNENKKDQ